MNAAPLSTGQSGDQAGPHVPVMLAEVLQALEPHAGARIIDGTFGAGGYSRAILARADCNVLAIDRDINAINAGAALVDASSGRLQLAHGAFSELEDLAKAAGWDSVDGIVLDLGVSSMQLDQAERGFSFQNDGPLDMRMGQEGANAADAVNTLSETDLANVIFRYGEERKSRIVAKRIVEARERAPFIRTKPLADLIADTIGRRQKDKIHPATRTFQALRIFVNRELHELADALFAAERLLHAGGRLVVVAFHSLEDRIVKRFFADRTRTTAGGSRHLPQETVAPATFTQNRRGTILPSDTEARQNPRARSARLRYAIRSQEASRASDAPLLGLADFPENPFSKGQIQ